MDLTNKQWEFISPYLPKRIYRIGRPRKDDREILNGILWILRTGAPWKDLPDRYPPYQTCHRRFQEWNRLELWPVILKALSEHLDISEGSIDATFAPAKKGARKSVRQRRVRVRKLWQLQTKMAILALSQYLKRQSMKQNLLPKP